VLPGGLLLFVTVDAIGRMIGWVTADPSRARSKLRDALFYVLLYVVCFVVAGVIAKGIGPMVLRGH
jgi:hypothetical protein